ELEGLAEQVNREIAQATGRDPTERDNQPGQNRQQGQPGQQGQQGNQDRQPGQRGQQGQRGEQPGDQPGQQGQRGQQGQQGGQDRGGGNARPREGAFNGPGNPIRGEGYREWADRMRAAEELIEDPQLRAEAARIRDRVRGTREDFKRHAKEPDWNQLRDLVS